ncbi:hypothetical protein [Kribbella sp. NPDC050470]|uniref:hypothetical protein n=1 Tax=unclassified Kribbella TaxID=2644121 RepID=UPI0037A92FC6
MLQSSIEDTLCLQRINRIRRFYHEASPGLSDYLGVAAPTDDIAAVLALDGYLRSHRRRGMEEFSTAASRRLVSMVVVMVTRLQVRAAQPAPA